VELMQSSALISPGRNRERNNTNSSFMFVGDFRLK